MAKRKDTKDLEQDAERTDSERSDEGDSSEGAELAKGGAAPDGDESADGDTSADGDISADGDEEPKMWVAGLEAAKLREVPAVGRWRCCRRVAVTDVETGIA